MSAAIRYGREAYHYPRSLPVLREFGEPIGEPTTGDVDALIEGCRRIVAGEHLTATGREGARIDAHMTGDYGVLRINGVAQYASNAYDLAVMFYGACWRWQVAWEALEGRL